MIARKTVSLTRITAGLIALFIGVVCVTAAQARPPADTDTPTEIEATNKVYMPATLSGRPTTWSRDSIFGVQMYNDSRPQSRYYPSLMASGATWLRIAVHWSAVEPNNTYPGAFAWNRADAPLAAAERKGITGLRVIGTIETAPEWARLDPIRPDGPIKPAYLPDFKEFVGALVERYDGDGFQDAPGSPIVDYWEFYNEPDRRLDTYDGRWGQHPQAYAQMLAAVYPVVKQANPRAQVVFGGIAYDFFENQGGPFIRSFLDDVLAAGGGQYFDIFNFHTYPAFASNWLPPGTVHGGAGLYQKTVYLRNKLQAAGINKPFIVTEAGWHSNNLPNQPGTDEIQARYVAQLFAQSLAADLDVMIWWMLYDPGEGAGDNGLVTRDTVPVRKPSFTAYQTVVNMLTSETFVRVLPLSETKNAAMEAYEFRDSRNGRTLYIAWVNPVDAKATAALAVAAEEVRIITLYGASGGTILDASDGADDGRVTLNITGQPVYIEVIR